MITSKQQHINYNRASFDIPAFSKILNIFLDNDMIILMYEYDPNETEIKIINIQYEEGLMLFQYEPPYNSKYWGTIEKTRNILDSSTNNSGMVSTNISINFNNFPEYFHIFVEEILPLCESRDRIIEEII